MFERTVSKQYRAWHERCQYRDRIDLLAGRLSNLGYARDHIPETVHEWLRFTKYCHGAGMPVPASIRAPEVEAYLRHRLPKATRHRKSIRTALRIFIEADDQGNFPRCMLPPPKPSTPIFNQWVVPYVDFLREHRGLSEGTLHVRVRVLSGFAEFVDKKGIHDLASLSANHIHDFCRNPGGRIPRSWANHVSIVRCFLKYVFSRQGLQSDLSLAVARTKHFRQAGFPDVLTGSEVTRILGAADRSSPLGRRDFAILLLAARYGMRPGDIRRLRLDDVHWRERYITFRQSKTGGPLTLPLLPEVSEALIDYLRAGRPPVSSRCIFVGHKAPFAPLGRDMVHIMAKALRRAGLDCRRGSGLYLLRHTLATRMLRAQVPLKTIGDILGHASTGSTFGYTKVDISALRSASLSLAEVLP